MKNLTLLIPLIFMISCSDKSSQLQKKDNQYQRFLNQKTDKILDKELEHYEK